MASNATREDRDAIRRRLSTLSDELRKESEFQEFAATTDVDYRMSDARIKAIKAEMNALKELKGDL